MMRTIDADLQMKTREELLEEVMQLRDAIREEDRSECDSSLWALLPEKTPPLTAKCRWVGNLPQD